MQGGHRTPSNRGIRTGGRSINPTALFGTQVEPPIPTPVSRLRLGALDAENGDGGILPVLVAKLSLNGEERGRRSGAGKTGPLKIHAGGEVPTSMKVA